jgi:hypothetical protein
MNEASVKTEKPDPQRSVKDGQKWVGDVMTLAGTVEMLVSGYVAWNNPSQWSNIFIGVLIIGVGRIIQLLECR